MNDNPYASPEQLLEQTALGLKLRGPDYYYRPLKGLLLAHLITGIATVAGSAMLDLAGRAFESRLAFPSAQPLFSQSRVFELIFGLGALVVLVSLVAWHILFLIATMRLASNSHALGNPPPKTTPLFAILYFMIPIVNLYKPYYVFSDFYKACEISPRIILPTWWAFHLAYAIDLWVGLYTALYSDSEFDLAIIQYPVYVGTLVFSQLVLTQLSARQAQLAHQLPASTSPPTALNELPPMRFSSWGGD